MSVGVLLKRPYRFDQNKYKNESALTELYPKRKLPDEVTAAFVESFFTDKSSDERRNETNMIRNLFVDYTYTYIRSMLLTSINQELIDQAQLPLLPNEEIELVYKGGNIMNIFYETRLKNAGFDQACMDVLNSPQLSDNFKVSDVDYTISIHTLTADRYEIIKIISERILYNIMENMIIFFEYMLNNPMIDGKPIDVDHSNIDMMTDLQDFILLDEIYDRILPHISSGTDPNINIQTIIDEVIKLTSGVKQYSSYVKDMDKIIKLVNILTSLLTFKNDKPKQNTIRQLISELLYYRNTIIDFKKQQLINVGMYKRANIELFKNNIVQKMSKMDCCDPSVGKNIIRMHHNGTMIDVDRIVQSNQIQIEGRASAIIDPSPSTLKQEEFNIENIQSIGQYKKTAHYLTFNDTISYRRDLTNINFDLMRIKLNTCINGATKITDDSGTHPVDSYKIPSEFIDVSIANSSDISYIYFSSLAKERFGHYDKYLIPIFSSNLPNYKIYFTGYSANQIRMDLEMVLYYQTILIMPWLAGKADKRLKRFLLFSLCVEKNNDVTNAIYKYIVNISDYIDQVAPKDPVQNKRQLNPQNIRLIYDRIIEQSNNFMYVKLTDDLLARVLDKFVESGHHNIIGLYVKPGYDVWESFISAISIGSLLLYHSELSSLDVINKIRNLNRMVPIELKDVGKQQEKYIETISVCGETFKSLNECLSLLSTVQQGGKQFCDYKAKYIKYKSMYMRLLNQY
jgi:hypothetical protein